LKKIFKDALSLTLIAVILGVLLGTFHEITKEPIANQEKQTKTNALKNVLPGAERFEEIDISDKKNEIQSSLKKDGMNAQIIDEVYKGVDRSGNFSGYAVTVTSQEGYGGDIQLTVGIADDHTTNGISFLELDETAGLGMNADTDKFKEQFKGKKVDAFEYTKDGATSDDQIDAISGATVTTNAVTNAVNACIHVSGMLDKEGMKS
jgi:electron transport complex protein RnfG